MWRVRVLVTNLREHPCSRAAGHGRCCMTPPRPNARARTCRHAAVLAPSVLAKPSISTASTTVAKRSRSQSSDASSGGGQARLLAPSLYRSGARPASLCRRDARPMSHPVSRAVVGRPWPRSRSGSPTTQPWGRRRDVASTPSKDGPRAPCGRAQVARAARRVRQRIAPQHQRWWSPRRHGG